MYIDKKVINKVIELQDLESNYGSISCFDVPEAYEEMEIINDFLYDYFKKEFSSYISEAIELLKNALLEVDNIKNVESIKISRFEEYINDMEHSSVEVEEVFNSFFYWMGIDDRKKYIASHYLDGEEFIFYKSNVEVILEVMV